MPIEIAATLWSITISVGSWAVSVQYLCVGRITATVGNRSPMAESIGGSD